MKIIFLSFACYCLILAGCDHKPHHTVIAFGSCSHETDSIQMWDQVLVHHPKAWIWMGDNIYGDTRDMKILKMKYDKQKQRPSYQKLMKSTKVYGIWDDHDYGVNDGGKEYPMKNESKELLLDFLDIPADADVRGRQGAYQSHTITDQNLSIKLILLDTRYFRDSLAINLDRPPMYLPNYAGTVLGETQWQWLEDELTNSTADIHLIGSSYQLIPNDHGYEKWGNFPNERKRFFELITKTKPARPIILSGDRHIAEFSKIHLDGLEQPLYEFTSSGLTHSWNISRQEENANRVGDLMIEKNFGIIEIQHDGENIQIKLIAYGSQNKVIGETMATFDPE